MMRYCDSFGIYALVDSPSTPALSQASLITRWNGCGVGNPNMGVKANAGNRGNPALYLPFGASIAQTFAHQNKYTIGFTLNIESLAGVGGGALISFYNCTRSLVTLFVNTDGSILVFGNDTPATVILTTGVVLTATTDCFLSFSATISGTTNMTVDAEVRVNGVSVGTGSASIGRNVNTLVSNTATFNRVFLESGMATNGRAYISDLYLNDGSGSTNTGFSETNVAPYLRIDPILPNGDNTPLQWTPNSGSVHYDRIDELPADTADYNGSSTAGNVDSYNWENIPSFIGTVGSVQISYFGLSTEEGLRTFCANIGAGGTEEQSDTFGLCSTPLYHHQAFDLDPATAEAWIQTLFNAKPFGIGLVD